MANTFEESINKNYRNVELEYSVLAYLAKESPVLAATVRSDWFQSSTCRKVLDIIKDKKTVFNKSSLLHEVRASNPTSHIMAVWTE